MKIYNKLRVAGAITLFCSLGLTACLEDEGYEDIVDGMNKQNIVEFFGDQAGGLSTQVFELKAEPQDLNVVLNLASPNKLGSDVSVTLGADPEALTAFNEAQAEAGEKEYELLPAETYTLPSSVVIKAGERESVATIKVNTSLIDLSKSYLLPVSITDAQGAIVSGNFKTVLKSIAVKNQYDGEYHASGVFNHPTAGPRDIDQDKTLSTIDGNTVETDFADLGPAWKMWLRVNADNSVTLIPKAGANPATVPNGLNTYDPATKTFTLNYKYAGAGGDRVINETIAPK
jgi:hypothetical protein